MVDRLPVIERCAWWCPACRWTASYAEPMLTVYCVRCMHEGRGADQKCEKFVPASDLRGAVSDAEHGRALVDRMFALPRGPEWEQALAELRVWSMKDHNPTGGQ